MLADEEDVDLSENATLPSRRQLRRWALLSVVLLLCVVAMLATVLAGQPTFRPPGIDSPAVPMPTQSPQQDGVMGGVPEISQPGWGEALLTVLRLAIVLLIAAGALYFIIRLLMQLWRDRPLRRQKGAHTDGVSFSAVVAPLDPDTPLRREDIAEARDVAAAQADAGEAIIAAWVSLERTAMASGTAKGDSETPSEFTARLLARRPSIDDDAAELLRLYERVRFGGVPGTETDRSNALAALERIEAEWR